MREKNKGKGRRKKERIWKKKKERVNLKAKWQVKRLSLCKKRDIKIRNGFVSLKHGVVLIVLKGGQLLIPGAMRLRTKIKTTGKNFGEKRRGYRTFRKIKWKVWFTYHLVFEISEPERRVAEDKEDRQEDADQEDGQVAQLKITIVSNMHNKIKDK